MSKAPKILDFDARRRIIVPGNKEETINYCVEHFIDCYREGVKKHKHFSVALSGGSTPKAIYQKLCSDPHKQKIDWNLVHLFWGDERNVLPTDKDSNYKMAMEAGFKDLVPASQIHRMMAETQLEENATLYEELMNVHLVKDKFDLIMLGMGPDGHTASLFPGTEGLKERKRKVVPNWVPQKDTFRMTMTFEAINHNPSASHILIYVLGKEKQERLGEIFDPDNTTAYPVEAVGIPTNKATYILDEDAVPDILSF